MAHRKRRNIKLPVSMAMSVDAARRFLGDLRPADWLIICIELAFLIVVAAQWIVDAIHKRRLQKRRNEVFALLLEANKLRASTPVPFTEHLDYAIVDWVLSVEKWRKTASALLAVRSERAATRFMLIVSANTKDATVYDPFHSSFVLTADQLQCYQMLLCHIDNLSTIMEMAESYF